MADKYGYIGVETLLNFCENSKDHAATPNDFMRMNRVRVPERTKGEWIPSFNGRFTGGAYWFECSECNRIVPDVRNGGWNFCPNCGAKMEEG